MKKIYKCKNCGDPFSAREADRKRGWARYCSKSCKAKLQYKTRLRHNGQSPMKYKKCFTCGEPAINGIYTAYGIEWGCELHHDTTHPFDSSSLGQW